MKKENDTDGQGQELEENLPRTENNRLLNDYEDEKNDGDDSLGEISS